MAKANIKKMNNPYFERWKSMFNDLVYKCSLMCTLENECLEAPIRIPEQVWEDTDSLQSNIMSMSVGEVIDAIDKIYTGLYNARYGEYSASTKKSKQPSINDISFEANVNSLRKTNYAKCGNINTIVKERK